jgi:16S rRNA (adenine1518-N6/adenine1519-N6)-dimethyltransferase
MTYQNKGELLEMLKNNDLFAKKKLGQNFLISGSTLTKIVETADLSKKDYVIEVGPGFGILTEQLALKADRVSACEYDAELIPILKKNLQAHTNIEIIHEDALKLRLPSENYKLVANIPYYITSPILMHFLDPKTADQKRPELIVLLVQKEVAQKICVKQGEYSVLSLEVQIFGKPSIAGYVNKNCFYPEPKVDSAILKIEVFPTPAISDTTLFMRIIKTAFSQRRKTLINSLRSGIKCTREELDEILLKAEIIPSRRPQELSIEEWQKLVDALKAAALPL